MRLLRTTCLATLLGSVPVLAWAQGAAPVNGPYISFAGGDNFLQSLFTHPSLSPNNEPASRIRFNDGYVVAVSAGWGFGNGFRTELEGAYDYNSVINRVRTPNASRTNGNQGTYGVLGNVYYDVDLTKLGTDITFVQPFVGLGAGVLWTQLPSTTAALNNSDTFTTSGTGANFAGQAIIGLGFPIQAVPGLKFNIDYRFIGIAGNSGLVGTSYTPAGRSTGTVHVSPPFLHQIGLSVAYAFNSAPPAPPPAPPTPVAAPAPQAARTYLVFFDWDRADLTPRARQIIGQAAQGSSEVQTTRIDVNGYTDLSGSARYNQGLSVRRAQAVAGELVRDGVPQAEIGVQGFGESNPLVPTAAGVREPQNRRVEIILR